MGFFKTSGRACYIISYCKKLSSQASPNSQPKNPRRRPSTNGQTGRVIVVLVFVIILDVYKFVSFDSRLNILQGELCDVEASDSRRFEGARVDSIPIYFW